MIQGQFGIKKDNKKPCFCQACITGKWENEMSPIDPRYCFGCYDFLVEEAGIDTSRKGKWQPRKLADVPQGVRNLMSTLKSKKSVVDIKEALPPSEPVIKVRRRRKDLPLDLIRELAGNGMGSKAIATTLKSDSNIIVTYKTIQRVLSGERN